jgi:hypothetical protein
VIGNSELHVSILALGQQRVFAKRQLSNYKIQQWNRVLGRQAGWDTKSTTSQSFRFHSGGVKDERTFLIFPLDGRWRRRSDRTLQ